MMSFYQRGGEKRKNLQELQMKGDLIGPCSPKNPRLDLEKRQRREVANSNERRRMQSINAGFQSLRSLIPHHQGDKLSKAAILQQTADYISNLEDDKSNLLSQNHRLRQMLLDNNPSLRFTLSDGDLMSPVSPLPKRQKRDTESSDEGISVGCDGEELLSPSELRRELANVKKMLQQERKRRLLAEEDREEMERGMYSSSSSRASPTAEPTPTVTPKDDQPTAVKQPVEVEVETPVVQEEENLPRQAKCRPASPAAAKPILDNSKSSRNMEILLEAFRLIEGDHSLFDSKPESRLHLPANSEESEKESSSSEYEFDAVGSGRDSPLSRLSDTETSQAFMSRALPCRPESLPSQRLHPANMSSLRHYRPVSVVSANQS